jgi:hypothetical protein
MTTMTEPAKAYLGKEGHPWYATTADFDVQFDADHKFPFYEDENGCGIYGFGHMDKAEFAAQVNQYDTLCTGEAFDERGYVPEDVIHCWAVITAPKDEDGSYQFSWRGIDSRTLGAWPLTRVDR